MDYLIKIKKDCNGQNNYYDNIDINKIVSNNAIKVNNLSNNNYELVTKSYFYPDFFLKSTEKVSTRAKTFLKTLLNTYSSENNLGITLTNPNTLTKYSPISTTWIYLISSFSLIIVSLAYFIIEYAIYKKHINQSEVEYDNETIYRTFFHKSYWKNVFNVFKDIRKISGLAMMLALMILCKMISLPSGFGNLGISITYIVFATASLIYGPFAGFILGIFSDILGYVLFQSSYAFFIGYTFQAALCGMIYGLCFYKTKISYQRAFTARLFVNLFMNVVLGSICWGIVSSYNIEQTFYYALVFELPKNIIYLVPQSIVLYAVLKAIAPALRRLGLIKKEQYIYFK